MKKSIKNLLSFICASAFLCSVAGLTACGGGGAGEGGPQGGGATSTGDGALSASFYLDAGGQDLYHTYHFDDTEWIEKPTNPTNGDKMFVGWYADANYQTAFNFVKKYDSDQKIYARWFDKYTFEAEYTQLTDLDPDVDLTADSTGNKIGYGYSNNVGGLQLIAPDTKGSSANASNGYWVGSLYYNGAFLEFEITSDKAVSDAQLVFRMSAEYYNQTFAANDLTITVRGADTDVADATKIPYEGCVIDNVVTDMNTEKKRPFTDFTITTKLALAQGKNIIRLQVTNSEKQGSTGTMNAKAPMVDCMYIYTDAALTWDPYTDNIGK